MELQAGVQEAVLLWQVYMQSKVSHYRVLLSVYKLNGACVSVRMSISHHLKKDKRGGRTFAYEKIKRDIAACCSPIKWCFVIYFLANL